MSNWELEQVEPVECTIDSSGVYTVINRVVKTETHKQYSGQRLTIRVDVMRTDTGHGDEPLRSFVGPGNDVRKRVISYLGYRRDGMLQAISHEHASYIGYEVARAMIDPGYVQD